MSNTQLILALDFDDKTKALNLLKDLQGSLKWVKIGLAMFTKYGPEIVKEVSALGYKIFLDLKLHDIPNTVASAIDSLKDLPISMLTIHSLGGSEMMRSAFLKAKQTNPELLVLAVSVLTSMNEEQLNEIGVNKNPKEEVLNLAKLAKSSLIEGLVCSPLELVELRKILGESFNLVTPGVRPVGASLDEQKRVTTPTIAAQNGASYIVVGRPIIKADNPKSVALAIMSELENA